jgi:hypothetical protein
MATTETMATTEATATTETTAATETTVATEATATTETTMATEATATTDSDNFFVTKQRGKEKTFFPLYFAARVFAFPNRVARWFHFKPKIPIWVNFGGP